MRTQTINNSTLGITNGTIGFPDNYSYVFNPNYIEFDANSTSFSETISVSVKGKDITTGEALSYTANVSTYKGKTRIYVSRMMQLMFCDYVQERCQIIELNVTCGSTSLASDTVNAIWGGLKIDDLFSGPSLINAPFKYWPIPHKRDLKWFRKFPFTVSIHRPNSTSYFLQGKKDHGAFSTITNSSQGVFEIDPSKHFADAVYSAGYQIYFEGAESTFDKTFDYTFHSDGDKTYETVNLQISDDDTAGYYLRWIDRFGFLEYWLFVKGDKTTKVSYGTDSISVEKSYEGVNFGGIDRYVETKSETSVKASAVSLTPTQMFVVETICESSHVDLYLGKDKSGVELWLPVNVASGSYKTKANTNLQDLEITIDLPNNVVQKL